MKEMNSLRGTAIAEDIGWRFQFFTLFSLYTTCPTCQDTPELSTRKFYYDNYNMSYLPSYIQHPSLSLLGHLPDKNISYVMLKQTLVIIEKGYLHPFAPPQTRTWYWGAGGGERASGPHTGFEIGGGPWAQASRIFPGLPNSSNQGAQMATTFFRD